jgi:hypothetical protein
MSVVILIWNDAVHCNETTGTNTNTTFPPSPRKSQDQSREQYLTPALDGGEWSPSRPGRALPPLPIG